MTVETSRRGVLAGGMAAAGALALEGCGETKVPGTLGGADFSRGHRIRSGGFPSPDGTEQQAAIVIAGGGIAGLAAGWRLAEAGFTDFELFELEDATGGNSRSGSNAVSAYPLGAHYLPTPNREAKALRHMLKRFGMVTDGPDGVPVYDPYQLCADLEERLFWRGEWQEGLYPHSGLSPEDMAHRDAFFAAMATFSQAVGSDGKPAFAIPMAYSSSDSRLTALDRMSFTQWLDAQGWTSHVLRDHLRYCCRDDYGTEPEHLSAWAGIHYFAGRRGWAANGDGDRELTWPEGNGRLATLMADAIRPHIRTGRSVFHLAPDGTGAAIDSFDDKAGHSVRTRAKAAILAMPHFVASRIAPGLGDAKAFSYAPWVVANVTVSRHPGGKGVPLAWDNVSTASESLGYVVATHQSQSTGSGPTVLTWYMPLSQQDPAAARKAMLTRPLADWQREVRDDLLALHPELSGAIERIDVWRWGHAMIRPTTGFIFGEARARALSVEPPLFHAHSDLSGLSLFEEAHYRGVLAAEAAMRHLGHAFETLL
ncbi:MAG: NAD(P)-binding protein [Novosphingobium sp.]